MANNELISRRVSSHVQMILKKSLDVNLVGVSQLQQHADFGHQATVVAHKPQAVMAHSVLFAKRRVACAQSRLTKYDRDRERQAFDGHRLAV